MIKNKVLIVVILILQFTFASASAQFTKLLDFNGTQNGQYPYGSLISDGTFLYGMTNYGGTNNLGTVFKMMPDGTGFLKLLDFTGASNGQRLHGSLLYNGAFLYGVTSSGGTNDFGTIFKIKTDGTGYVKLIDFSNVSNGNSPFGTLISDSLFLYGTTAFGGINSNGTLFKIRKDGSEFLKLLDFGNVATGKNPWNSLIFDGTFLYGTTQYGGINNNGVIFKIQTDGNSFTKLYDFGGVNDGKNPFGSLISDGTFLYGTTRQGGTANKGTLFKINTNSSGYTKLLDFIGTSNGTGPQSSLVFDGTYLYGMTTQGGANNFGVIFKLLPNGLNFSKLFDFDDSLSGSSPLGSINIIGNNLYGMASNGGVSNKGTLFNYSLIPLEVQNNNLKSLFSIYPNPTNGNLKILSAEKGIKSVITFNILGQEVNNKIFLGNNYEENIDFSFLASGIYSLKVISVNNETQNIKFIKEEY